MGRDQINISEEKKEFLDETLYSRYKIEVPEGILFYPCCGDDTFEPIKLFIDTVSEYHFVDTKDNILLPILGCNLGGPYKQYGGPSAFSKSHIIPSYIVKSIGNRKIERRVVESKILDRLNELEIEPVGYRNKETVTKMEEWVYMPNEDRKIQVYRHRQDGLIKFMELDEIAVFFLRGDSLGEGGSGQRWFEPEVFNLVIDKLVDGGFIVTDESIYYDDFFGTLYKPLYEEDKSLDINLLKPKDFNCKGRRFICIGECGYRYGTVYLWKVEKE